MELVKPRVEYKDSFIEAIKEFPADEKTYDFEKNLDISELENNFEKFIDSVNDREKGIGLPEGYVPDSIYFLVDNGEFIGRVAIRHKLTEKLLLIGGHIGYSIRPRKRKQGYGTKILELALLKAKELGITKVLVTCDDTNIGSAKIIEKNGGILENKVDFEKGIKRRYWINI